MGRESGARRVKKLLIVDDEEAFSGGVLKPFLEEDGRFQVAIEKKGTNAVTRALEFNPDLIFLDVMMRDCAGPVVAKKIRACEELKGVPIIFLTATQVRNDQRESGIFDGAIGEFPYIAKPVTLERIRACLQECFKGQ